ncbi:helix-turn-helix domain-containing protein [Vibrio sp. S4M6]|uniref:S24 family peptidase n=1 Tax=Vibrio sinus TaxID=2946865 RepID=UPI00202AA84F|nr:S24 family peptidase [Vibrio sinus]MCL9782145.1 helix-turn-helix domain-containing protein [Vibrio sinus]
MRNIRKLYLNRDVNDSLVINIRRLMQNNDVSEAKLSRYTGIPQSTLHKLLTGETLDPRISTLQSLASHFHVTVDELIDKKEKVQPKTQAIPIISWSDSIHNLSMLWKNISVESYERWVVVEPTSELSFALLSKPSMEPRFPKETVFIVNPEVEAIDGDIIVVHYPDTQEATLRVLSIDGPNRLLLPINTNSSPDPLQESIRMLGVVVQSRFSYNK